MKGTVSVFLLGWLLLPESALASPAQPPLQNEEYAVYVSLITDTFLGRQRAVVIENRTTFNAGDDLVFLKTQPDLSQRLATLDERYAFLGQQLGGISLETLTDFRAKDTRAYKITPKLRLPAKYTLLSKEQVSKLFQRWEGYWRYPNTTGAITFSRVGFNEAKTEAIVYVGFSCGRHCCSSSRFVFLTRTKQGWKTRGDYITWIT